MNVVIYTRDMEPITVIDLPMWALEFGERMDYVRVALPNDVVMATPASETWKEAEAKMRVVTLEFVAIRLARGHHDPVRRWLIVADDDELALALRPSWLPGQRRKVNEYERANRELATLLLNTLAHGAGGH